MKDCTLAKGQAGRCYWCNADLPGRRRRWCSDECERTWLQNHMWNMARRAALERDDWTCVRCGLVAWWDVPQHVLPLTSTDHTLDGIAPSLEDWAIALGLLGADWDSGDWLDADMMRRTAIDRLPAAVREIVQAERLTYDWRRSPRGIPGGHTLEVNHREPRRGRGYTTGCWNHLEGLETLCRPCHVDETTRQRRGLPSWREDPRPLETLGTPFEETG